MPYQFHVYYHVRRMLKRLQVPSGHMKLVLWLLTIHFPVRNVLKCEDYRVPHNPMKEKLFGNTPAWGLVGLHKP